MPPAPEIKYPQEALDLLTSVDYDKFFVVLLISEPRLKDSIVRQVIRKGNKVSVLLYERTIGPGNYVLDDWTLPYNFIVIEKAGVWGENVHFNIRSAQNEVLNKIDHYIP